MELSYDENNEDHIINKGVNYEEWIRLILIAILKNINDKIIIK